MQDAVNAYLWLRDTAGDQGKIVVAGDSSAGGLVMSLLLALRERGLPAPAGAVLLCPWIDLTGRTQRPPQDSPLVFSPDMAHRLAQAYLAGHPADDPLLDPLHTSLAGLPPLLIHAASGDSALQEAQLLTQHATSAASRPGSRSIRCRRTPSTSSGASCPRPGTPSTRSAGSSAP